MVCDPVTSDFHAVVGHHDVKVVVFIVDINTKLLYLSALSTLMHPTHKLSSLNGAMYRIAYL